jgi:hypothetical protein
MPTGLVPIEDGDDDNGDEYYSILHTQFHNEIRQY